MKRQIFTCDKCGHAEQTHAWPAGWWGGRINVTTYAIGGGGGFGAVECHLCPTCRVNFVPPDSERGGGANADRRLATEIVRGWLHVGVSAQEEEVTF